MGILRNDIKLAWRSFKRDKLYSLVKICSLAIGIAACILIALFIRHELSYDKHYKNTGRIFRVYNQGIYKGEIYKETSMPAPLYKVLVDEYPEIEKSGRINSSELFGAGSHQVRRGDQLNNSFEKGFVYADQGTLEILESKFIYGNPQNALIDAGAVVISKSRADKFFPNENPVGKTIIVNNDTKRPLKVTGVIEDFPENSHLDYHFFVALYFNIFGEGERTRWTQNNYDTYVLVKYGTDIPALEKKLKGIVTKYLGPAMLEGGYVSKEDIHKFGYGLQPIDDIHLRSGQITDGKLHGDIRIIRIFGAIAVCIIILACINFINLSLAKSGSRAMEAGFRKTVGAKSNSILMQFLFESVFYSMISVISGLILAWLFLPLFNSLSSKSLTIPLNEWWFFPSLVLVIIGIGAVAGIYPSLYLSGVEPVKVIKRMVKQSGKMSGVYRGMVVFQFTISIILIIGAGVVLRQMNFIVTKDVGFEKEQVLILKGTKTLKDKIETFKNELLTLPNVKNVSISNYLPIEGTMRNGNTFWHVGKRNTGEPIAAQSWRVDHDYVETLGLKIIDGRNFSKERTSDANAVIINRMMAQRLHFDQPIGKMIDHFGQTIEIIGVVEDFHFNNIKEKIWPLCLRLGNSTETMSVKINTADVSSVLKSIEEKWVEFSPNQPIRYRFLDDEFAMMHDNVQRISRILLVFAVLAIFIACLGLFALAQYSIKNRIKEIGIRKVNGSKISEILELLNKDFIVWVVVAYFMACPIAYYTMSKWLESFAYKTTLSWWIFALAGLTAIIVALLTVSWQSWKAANRNPVEALRYE